MGLSRRQFLASTTLLSAATVAGCTTSVSGQARPNPDDLKKVRETPAGPALPDTVSVVVIAYQPYTVQTGGELSGPVPDVARKVLTGIGVRTVKFVLVREQEKVLTMAAAGALDMAGGLAVQPQLCSGLTFSRPDYVSGTALAVPAGNPKGLTTYADIISKGATVGTMAGAPEQNDAQKAGVSGENLRVQPDPLSLLHAVQAGQIDCFAFDDLSLREIVKTNGQGLEVTAPFMPDGRLPLIGAYSFAKDSPLIEPVNKALKELHDSGEWLRMVQPFGFSKNNEPPADLTIEKACAG